MWLIIIVRWLTIFFWGLQLFYVLYESKYNLFDHLIEANIFAWIYLVCRIFVILLCLIPYIFLNYFLLTEFGLFWLFGVHRIFCLIFFLFYTHLITNFSTSPQELDYVSSGRFLGTWAVNFFKELGSILVTAFWILVIIYFFSR